MDVARYTLLFLTDSRDHLRRSSALLLDWERHPASVEPVAELFRAFHSIKSSAATMGFSGIADLAHAAENLLEAVRRGERASSSGVLRLLLKAVDVLDVAVEAVATGGGEDTDAAALAEALTRMAGTGQPPVAPVPAPKPQRVTRPATRQAIRSVRIDPVRLDELMSQVGQLVVSRNRLEVLVSAQVGTELESVTSRIGSLVRAMHTGVLRARLAPLGELFERLPRVVRDLGVELGKSVRLELVGEGIELDRGMLEDLVDPIVHLLRNAVDHGIETAEVRTRSGKPAEGKIVIRAERRRDTVVIRLSDDGRGVDRDAVRRRAVLENMLPGEAPELDDGLLLALIARPGFTLKDQVTTVSGRGVGVDVALQKIRSLGGRMDLSTVPGKGTVFTLTFPLTTAIQRVLLVGVSPERYAIPFRHLAEAVRAAPAGNGTFSFRGETLPLVELRLVTGAPGRVSAAERPVLVLDLGDRRGALAVDTLLGQHDVVVERIEEPAETPRWLSGATILPDGAPALLLDPAALF
ncbi:MAG: chemotaxis protein CheW [Gemmatimonadota bacterium]